MQDVVEHVEIFDEGQRLKDEAHSRDSETPPFGFGESRDLGSRDDNAPRLWDEDARQQAEQSRFPAARGTNDRHALSARNLEPRKLQGKMLRTTRVACSVEEANVADCDSGAFGAFGVVTIDGPGARLLFRMQHAVLRCADVRVCCASLLRSASRPVSRGAG